MPRSPTVQAGSWIGASVRTSTVVCRSVWLAAITCWSAGSVAGSRRAPVSRRCVASSVSMSPASCTRDATSTIRWSQTRSRSETRCEDSTTLSSCSATASMRSCRNSRRASGSRLATGSSRISTCGRLATPSVSASWARWPPDSFPARCARSRPSRWIRSRARASSQPGLRWAPSRRWSSTLSPSYVGVS